MLFTSKELACASHLSDNLQLMQEFRRHDLPIEGRGFSSKNTYDLNSFAVSMVVGESREFGNSLFSCGRLLSPIDLDELSHGAAKLNLDKTENLIVLVPHRDAYDEKFQTTVTSWENVRHFGKVESINFTPVKIDELLKSKTHGQW